jgi:hypothetical protein
MSHKIEFLIVLRCFRTLAACDYHKSQRLISFLLIALSLKVCSSSFYLAEVACMSLLSLTTGLNYCEQWLESACATQSP